MKKRFELTAPNKEPQRVLESIKNEIRKYIKREKRKTLPLGFDIWHMDCKFANNEEEPQTIQFPEIIQYLDEAALANVKSIYLEIISSAVKREPKIVEEEKIVENDDDIVSEVDEIENIENNETV